MPLPTATKRILFLSYDGMTDALGQSQVLPYLCGLSKLGYAFTIISFEKADKLEQYRAHISALCEQHHITWIPLSYTKRPPVFSTVYDLAKAYRLVKKLHRQTSFSLVHCRSYVMSLVGLRVKRKLGIEFVFDMRGFWADERVDGGLWNLKNPLYQVIYRYFKHQERCFLEESCRSICHTHRAVAEMQTWKYLHHDKVRYEIIPCCADLDLFNPERIAETDKNRLRATLGIGSEDFVLTYVGSLGTWYMLHEMLDFFEVLQTRIPDAKMLFVNGNRSEQALIRTETEKRGISPNVVITQSPYTKMPLHIAISSWAIFFITPSYSKMASSPVKQGEIMAMGIPVFCNSGVGDTDSIVQQANAGIVVEGFTKAHYQAAIEAAFNMKKPHDASTIRAGAVQFFSLQKGILQYASVYQSVLT